MKKTISCLIISICIFGIAACSSSDRPSKSAVEKKMKALAKADDVVTEFSNKFITCFVDHIYDDSSTKTLKKFMKLNSLESTSVLGTKDEQVTFAKATSACKKYLQTQPADDTPTTTEKNPATSTTVAAKKADDNSATQNLLTAAASVKTLEDGTGNFSRVTLPRLEDAQPSFMFDFEPLRAGAQSTSIAILNIIPTQVILQSRFTNNVCYFIEINVTANNRFGFAQVGAAEVCPSGPSNSYTSDQGSGWSSN